MPAGVTEPLFLDTGADRRFAILFSPRDRAQARGALLFIPAFAEEMNKSRHVVAACARALSGQGWSVLLLDPLGTGDSPGDFADADWNVWIADVERAHRWLSRHTNTTAGLWAMRAGCLLATCGLPQLGTVPMLLLWQPVVSGRSHLTQFLRLKVAADSIAGGSGKATTRSLLEQLGRGELVEVGGYQLSPGLALPMNRTELTPPIGVRQVVWLEVASSAQADLSPMGLAALEKWRKVGVEVAAEAVKGVPFWQTQELEDCHPLVEATLRAAGPHHV